MTHSDFILWEVLQLIVFELQMSKSSLTSKRVKEKETTKNPNSSKYFCASKKLWEYVHICVYIFIYKHCFLFRKNKIFLLTSSMRIKEKRIKKPFNDDAMIINNDFHFCKYHPKKCIKVFYVKWTVPRKLHNICYSEKKTAAELLKHWFEDRKTVNNNS